MKKLLCVKSCFVLLIVISLTVSAQNSPDNQKSAISSSDFQSELSLILMKRDLGLYDAHLSSIRVEKKSSVEGKDIYHVVLDHSTVGTIRMLLRGPKDFLLNKNKNLKALMIVSGFFTGEKSIELISDVSDRILIGFEYPYNISDFQNDPATIFQFVRKTPGQIAVALDWLVNQSWLNSQGLSVMGVSLGGIFIPSGIRLAQNFGVKLEKTIFVCTGSDLPLILRDNLSEYFVNSTLDLITKGLMLPTILFDPRLHLPYLFGPFLVLQTDHDTVIPLGSQAKLYELLSNPKKEVVLPGPHVNSDQFELIKRIQDVVNQNLDK